MKFDIVDVFTRAAKITWKHKVLWIFGILASCGRGSGGNANSGSNMNGSGISDSPLTPQMTRQAESFFENLASWFEQNTWIIYAFTAAIFILLLVQIVIITIGQTGLIRGAHQAEMGVEKINFGGLYRESLSYFWRITGMRGIIFLPPIIILIGMFAVMIFIATTSPDANGVVFGAASLFIGTCCCLLPFMIALGLYDSQAVRAIILEDMGVWASISRGWEIFRKNIGGLFVVAFILFFVNLIIGIIVVLPIYIVLFPVMFSFLAGNIRSWQPFILTGIFILLYSPVAWFLNGILMTYTQIIWTLIYMRVTAPNEKAPVMIEANA